MPVKILSPQAVLELLHGFRPAAGKRIQIQFINSGVGVAALKYLLTMAAHGEIVFDTHAQANSVLVQHFRSLVGANKVPSEKVTITFCSDGESNPEQVLGLLKINVFKAVTLLRVL